MSHGKAHSADDSLEPFLNEWELDVVFEFVKWKIKESNVGYLKIVVPH